MDQYIINKVWRNIYTNPIICEDKNKTNIISEIKKRVRKLTNDDVIVENSNVIINLDKDQTYDKVIMNANTYLKAKRFKIVTLYKKPLSYLVCMILNEFSNKIINTIDEFKRITVKRMFKQIQVFEFPSWSAKITKSLNEDSKFLFEITHYKYQNYNNNNWKLVSRGAVNIFDPFKNENFKLDIIKHDSSFIYDLLNDDYVEFPQKVKLSINFNILHFKKLTTIPAVNLLKYNQVYYTYKIFVDT